MRGGEEVSALIIRFLCQSQPRNEVSSAEWKSIKDQAKKFLEANGVPYPEIKRNEVKRTPYTQEERRALSNAKLKIDSLKAENARLKGLLGQIGVIIQEEKR